MGKYRILFKTAVLQSGKGEPVASSYLTRTPLCLFPHFSHLYVASDAYFFHYSPHNILKAVWSHNVKDNKFEETYHKKVVCFFNAETDEKVVFFHSYWWKWFHPQSANTVPHLSARGWCRGNWIDVLCRGPADQKWVPGPAAAALQNTPLWPRRPLRCSRWLCSGLSSRPADPTQTPAPDAWKTAQPSGTPFWSPLSACGQTRWWTCSPQQCSRPSSWWSS